VTLPDPIAACTACAFMTRWHLACGDWTRRRASVRFRWEALNPTCGLSAAMAVLMVCCASNRRLGFCFNTQLTVLAASTP
jgi:hypothetical protein